MVEHVAKDFGGRCAFCEKQIHTSDGISHFRPISVHNQHQADDYVDHYSWLAYEWQNLFLICLRCQKARADRFPVADDRRARFLSTLDESRNEEKPLLIDPTAENPSQYLTYLLSGECLPKRRLEKSTTTIEFLRLNDTDLIAERQLAIEATLQSWDASLRTGIALPEYFLLEGSYLGACRESIARTLVNYRETVVSINNGKALRNYLENMLRNASDEELSYVSASIDILRETDTARLKESRVVEFDPTLRSPISFASERNSRELKVNEIASISIENFRAVDSLKVGFPEVRSDKAGAPCLLLLGENAVGKSTFLSSIALAILGTKEARKLKLRYHELARSTSRTGWNVWSNSPLEVNVKFHRSSQSATFFYDPIRERLDGTTEQSAIVLGYGPHRYFAPAKGRRGASAADQVRSLFDSQKALPDPSEWLKTLSGSQFDQVARTIRTILPTGDDDHLVNHSEYGICVLAQGQLTPVSHLSEGYRSIFAMVTDICRSLLQYWSNLERARAVVLIDEVETHLHPRWKMRVMSSLRRAFPAVQFIATTHDPLCVRGMDDGEVTVLARDELGSVQIVGDLPDVSGMSAEQILTSEYFGLSSTLDAEVHLEFAKLNERLQSRQAPDIGLEAKELIAKVTLGRSATAQIIHAALQRYLDEREHDVVNVAAHARAEAVATVLRALRASRGN
ncbi:TIGR02646 family protein [Massilia sp. KIM]|nr:TIGR02646 family protein [Massilia sp. KIM]